MRLLNVDSRRLEDFFADIPPYAILSHTWGEEEVSFQDLADPDHVLKKGYGKIDGTCRLAKDQNLQYAWIDTCCIDKSSSAELSEAINSMFAWYHNSAICYAYLQDVPPTTTPENLDEPESAFRRSRWFTRGWTLQELLAPTDVHFFGLRWDMLGERNEMRELLSTITAIPEACLRGFHPDTALALDHNLAQRMAWASERETNRAEDAAYCLLGIFNVHIPLLYGEGGERAFVRLQREMLTIHADESILAWNLDIGLGSKVQTGLGLNEIRNHRRTSPMPPIDMRPRSAFALSPCEFAPWRALQHLRFSLYPSQQWRSGTAVQLTNRGLMATLPIAVMDGFVLAVLNCSMDQRVDRMLMVPLITVGPPDHPNFYQRCAGIPAMVGFFNILSLAKIKTIFMQVSVRGFDAKRRVLAGRPQLRDGAVILDDTSEAGVALAEVTHGEWDGGQVIHPSPTVLNFLALNFEFTHAAASHTFQVLLRPVSRSDAENASRYEFAVQYPSSDMGWSPTATWFDNSEYSLFMNGREYSVKKTERLYLGFEVAWLAIVAV